MCIKINDSPSVEGDNWKHRSKGMTCGTCMFFVAKKRDEGEREHLGRCRKHAPSDKGWVPVFVTDWCGDHRLDENKI